MRHRRPHGRDPASLRFIPGLAMFAGHGAAEADGLYKDLNALFPPALGAIFAIELASSATYHDETLRAAAAYEREYDWKDRRPSLGDPT